MCGAARVSGRRVDTSPPCLPPYTFNNARDASLQRPQRLELLQHVMMVNRLVLVERPHGPPRQGPFRCDPSHRSNLRALSHWPSLYSDLVSHPPSPLPPPPTRYTTWRISTALLHRADVTAPLAPPHSRDLRAAAPRCRDGVGPLDVCRRHVQVGVALCHRLQ